MKTLLGTFLIAVLSLVLIFISVDATTGSFAWMSFSDSLASSVLWQLRLPRYATACAVGGALALSGVALQALLRNELAEPFTLGISSSSALAAVVAIRLGLHANSVLGVHAAALMGATLGVTLVWVLSRNARATNASRGGILLAGITISSFAGALSLLVQHTASFVEVAAMVRWMMGSLRDISSWSGAIAVGALMLLACVVLWRHHRHLDALSLGDAAAAGLGVDVEKLQRLLFGTSAMLVGVSIAVAGPIGFVGLMTPHITRRLVGASHAALIPWSVLFGAVGLALCDAASRLVIAPDQLAVGVLTSLLGGPFFLYLLLRGPATRG